MLAGLPNAPSLYSPYVDFKMAKKRQIVVLDAMVRNGYIDEKTAEDAKIKPLYFARFCQLHKNAQKRQRPHDAVSLAIKIYLSVVS